MRTVPAALNTHYALETTTLAHLWKVTRTDGQIFGFTDHDKDLSVSGVTYAAATGMNASAVRSSLGFAVDNLEVQGGFDSSAITEAELRAGLWDYARIDVYVANWASVSDGVEQVARGRLGRCSSQRGIFVAELVGLAKTLAQPIGRSILPACNADLGDARCSPNGEVTLSGSPSNNFFTSSTVAGVSSKRVFRCASLGQADGWYDFGKVTFTSGDNVGLSMEIKTSTDVGSPAETQITLMLPMPYTIAVGDAFNIKAGCDKRQATCISKFSNIANFRGYPFVPGPDEQLQYPDAH